MRKIKVKKHDPDENRSFVVEIKSKENHTWQGSIMWVEGQKKANFRSVLELLKLMDSTFERETLEQRNEFEKAI